MNYNTTTFNLPNAVIRVHCPVLTPEEHSKRMKAIYNASEALLKDIEKIKKR